MKEKLLIILVCSVLVLGPTGCGNKTNDNKVNDDKNSSNNSNSSIIGTYKAKESGIDTNIIINEDYSCHFLVTSPDIQYDSACTYEYNGENITFNLNSGDVIKAVFSDGVLLWENYSDEYDLKFYKQ